MAIVLDTAEESQANTPVQSRRTIYDAGHGEIFFKSLLAGFALGLGRSIATLIFFGLVLGLLLSVFQPIIDTYFPELNRFNMLMEQSLDSLPVTETSPFPTPQTTTN